MNKKMVIVLALLLLLLVGCATMRGIAEDTQNLGRGLKKTISEEESSSRRQTKG